MTISGRLEALALATACLIGAPGAGHAQAKPRFLNPPALPPSRGYTHVVEVPAGSRMLYISGQVPLDREGKLVGAGDFRRQAEQVFTNVGNDATKQAIAFAHRHKGRKR
jgi:enamine deaminase RidA (YjgF/YER057c/UK114 family)